MHVYSIERNSLVIMLCMIETVQNIQSSSTLITKIEHISIISSEDFLSMGL